MIEKIDSFMLCSQIDQSTAYQMQSTISFGKALEYQKISNKQTQVSSNVGSVNSHSNYSLKKVTLMEIYNEFLKDPLSTYTLELSSSRETQQCMASKTVNEKYGKYTTSIGRQEFQNQLQIQDTLIYSQPSQTSRVKLTKFSSILRMIKEKNQQKEGQKSPKNSPKTKRQRSCTEIKIEDMESINLDQRSEEKQKETDRPESQVFLGLESNISNKYEPIPENLNFKNRGSQNKPIQKEILSPVPQNPERKKLKIKNSNQKTVTNYQGYQGMISGLEFSKKLRKKTFNRKNSNKNLKVNPFQLYC